MILIIDFDDSFTFNIASELSLIGQKFLVIHYLDYIKDFKKYKKYTSIIWGPGPGHPNEYYSKLKGIFDQTLLDKKFKHLGICLGHQLILKYLGGNIHKRLNPQHGFVKTLDINSFWERKFKWNRSYKVQLYNSLYIKMDQEIGEKLFIDDELMVFFYQNILTYQFHPESIATENSSIFFNSYLSLVI